MNRQDSSNQQPLIVADSEGMNLESHNTDVIYSDVFGFSEKGQGIDRGTIHLELVKILAWERLIHTNKDLHSELLTGDSKSVDISMYTFDNSVQILKHNSDKFIKHLSTAGYNEEGELFLRDILKQFLDSGLLTVSDMIALKLKSSHAQAVVYHLNSFLQGRLVTGGVDFDATLDIRRFETLETYFDTIMSFYRRDDIAGVEDSVRTLLTETFEDRK